MKFEREKRNRKASDEVGHDRRPRKATAKGERRRWYIELVTGYRRQGAPVRRLNEEGRGWRRY